MGFLLNIDKIESYHRKSFLVGLKKYIFLLIWHGHCLFICDAHGGRRK